MADVSPSTAPTGIPRIRDPQFRDIYSNIITGRMGPVDISLMFSRIVEIAPGQTAVSDQCEITLSPQQCLSMIKILTGTMDAYQQVFGKLNPPKSAITPSPQY